MNSHSTERLWSSSSNNGIMENLEIESLPGACPYPAKRAVHAEKPQPLKTGFACFQKVKITEQEELCFRQKRGKVIEG